MVFIATRAFSSCSEQELLSSSVIVFQLLIVVASLDAQHRQTSVVVVLNISWPMALNGICPDHVLFIARQISNHWTTREVPPVTILMRMWAR